jgi:alpha-beta hydrolase superfamily lysophospholipase
MKVILAVVATVTLAGSGVACHGPAIAAGALLHPWRRSAPADTPKECIDRWFEGAGGIALRGWVCGPPANRRGTVVYLHGVADSRASGAGVIRRFVSRGLEVVAYDGRAHGESGGDVCTYGYFEKEDLRRVITAIGRGSVMVMGHSLGAAVALQAAADDSRISAVVSAESFSDLRTIARERAFFLPAAVIDRAFQYAEQRAQFVVDRVSPLEAAARIKAPVLIVHGTADDKTAVAHSERIFSALLGPKQFIRVDGARHTESLRRPEVWQEIDRWIDQLLTAAG